MKKILSFIDYVNALRALKQKDYDKVHDCATEYAKNYYINVGLSQSDVAFMAFKDGYAHCLEDIKRRKRVRKRA